MPMTSMMQAVFSTQLRRIVTHINHRVVSYDYNNNKRALIPGDFLRAVHAFEATVGNTVEFHKSSSAMMPLP